MSDIAPSVPWTVDVNVKVTACYYFVFVMVVTGLI